MPVIARRLRNYLPLLVLVVAGAVLIWVWQIWETHRQQRVLLSLATGASALVLELAWLVTLSPWSWRARGLAFASVCVVLGVFALCVRIEQVTGDLVPILTWRFAAEPGADLDARSQPAVRPEVEPVAESETLAWREWPELLGPSRNATVEGIELVRDWTSQPPREVWRRDVGAGWSGFAVRGDAAFTQEQRGETEMVTCYDLRTGEPRWTHGASARYDSVIGGVGPRATPTVTAERVYAMGALGRLSCLDRYTGELRWSRAALEENGGELNEWGTSCSPLVLDGRVIVSVGGSDGRSLVAYDAGTGEPLWHGGGGRSSYASPSLHVLAGVPQVVVFNHRSLAAHSPATGEVLWETAWPGSQPKVAQPVVLPDDRVLISSGYDVGCALYRVERAASDAGGENALTVNELWKTRRLKAKFSNFVYRDGSVYGLDDGIMVCLDPATGERRWKRGRFGHGQMVLAGALLVVTVETSGEVALVEPDPMEYRELARFQAFDHKLWNSPALAAPYLLLRTDREAVCYELAIED